MGRRAFLIAACVLLVLGCGGDEDGDTAPRSVTTPAGGELRVVGEEYSFDPASVVVEGAGRLTIRLANEGSLAHNLKLVRDGEETGGTPTFPAGRTESGSVELEPGSYEMVCTVGDHAQLGMTGTLRVN